nr:UvrB/UvrC motif-containing protein [Heliophilum fasciatum]
MEADRDLVGEILVAEAKSKSRTKAGTKGTAKGTAKAKDTAKGTGQERATARKGVTATAADVVNSPESVARLIADLEKEMQEAAMALEFERAALLRDVLIEIKGGAPVKSKSASSRAAKGRSITGGGAAKSGTSSRERTPRSRG